MSGCGGGCNCGSSCSCGSDCKCGKRRNGYSEFCYLEASTAQSTILGIAPEKMFDEESEMSFQGEGGCKCGSSCTCDPCTCK